MEEIIGLAIQLTKQEYKDKIKELEDKLSKWFADGYVENLEKQLQDQREHEYQTCIVYNELIQKIEDMIKELENQHSMSDEIRKEELKSLLEDDKK